MFILGQKVEKSLWEKERECVCHRGEHIEILVVCDWLEDLLWLNQHCLATQLFWSNQEGRIFFSQIQKIELGVFLNKKVKTIFSNTQNMFNQFSVAAF